MADNKRKEPRYPTQVKVHWRIATDNTEPGEWKEGVLLTAGGAGAFVRTHLTLEPDTLIEIRLPLRHGEEAVLARVRWASTDEPAGIGLQLEDPSPAIVDQIIDAVVSGLWIADQAEEKAKKSESRLFLADLSDLLDKM